MPATSLSSNLNKAECFLYNADCLGTWLLVPSNLRVCFPNRYYIFSFYVLSRHVDWDSQELQLYILLKRLFFGGSWVSLVPQHLQPHPLEHSLTLNHLIGIVCGFTPESPSREDWLGLTLWLYPLSLSSSTTVNLGSSRLVPDTSQSSSYSLLGQRRL